MTILGRWGTINRDLTLTASNHPIKFGQLTKRIEGDMSGILIKVPKKRGRFTAIEYGLVAALALVIAAQLAGNF